MTTPDDPNRCPACGTASIPDARYCEACGHELSGHEPSGHELASHHAGGTEGGADSTATVAVGPVNGDRGAATADPTPNAVGSLDATGQPAVDATSQPDALNAAGSPISGTSSPPAAECASCGHSKIDADGYCDNCGTRRPAAARHSDLDLGGLAGVSDIGSRHHHNEDAMGLAAFDGVTAAVVCDGVSSSTRPDTASTAAAVAATKVFVAVLPALAEVDARPTTTTTTVTGEPSTDEDGSGLADRDLLATTDDVGTHEVTRTGAVAALHDAAVAAQAAAAQAAGDDTNPNPPSTTFVAAVVTAAGITVGWVGDSRAYWVPDAGTPGDAACLTIDDTLAGQLGAAGVAMAADAPNAGALIRWLGADAMDTEPHINTLVPAGAGRLIVCSDGLYRYVPQPDQLAEATPVGSPIDVASALVRLALVAGGHDNVTVVVLPYPPEGEVRMKEQLS
jgi:serine/threonine protein phosphatase PrpC